MEWIEKVIKDAENLLEEIRLIENDYTHYHKNKDKKYYEYINKNFIRAKKNDRIEEASKLVNAASNLGKTANQKEYPEDVIGKLAELVKHADDILGEINSVESSNQEYEEDDYSYIYTYD